MINAETLADVHTDDPDGDGSGTWYCDIDASRYDGPVEIAVKGWDAGTRYGVWSPFVTLQVENPAASKPVVTIDSPADGTQVDGAVMIEMSVQAKNPLSSAEVRIDGGKWLKAKADGSSGRYKYLWKPLSGASGTSRIEARATDQRGNVGTSLTTYVRLGGAAAEPVTVEPQDRAIWIWEKASYNLFYNDGSKEVLDALAQDTATFQSDPVTTFYLGIDQLYGTRVMQEAPEKVRAFVSWAHSRGYKVHATIAGGTILPYMGAYSRYHEIAVRTMEDVINYNLSAAPDERFDGVNVDIEPYILPDFKTAQPSVQIQYLDGLSKMIQRRDAAGINLPFGTVIPRWYDSAAQAQNIPWRGTATWLSEHVQNISDYVAIMDYRDTADGSAGIIQGALGELAYANAIGKPGSVVIAVETLDIADGGDPETITFREEGRTHMESELDKVYAAVGSDPAFAGIAMHHYDPLRQLPSDWGPDRITWEPPADDSSPSAVSVRPTAAAFDHQRIDVTFGRAFDNTEVEEYYVYRSTDSGFEPDESNLAGSTRGLLFSDTGLLPNTTYYYKVAAVDVRGNRGPASDETSAVTGDTPLAPMVVRGMEITHTGTSAKVSLRVVDKETNAPIPAAIVHGRFAYGAGKFVDIVTDADGMASATSEAVAADRQVDFIVRRITAPGYYWAKAYDVREPLSAYEQQAETPSVLPEEEHADDGPHQEGNAVDGPHQEGSAADGSRQEGSAADGQPGHSLAGLLALTFGQGELSPVFSPDITRYTLNVERDVSAVNMTAAAAPETAVAVNDVPLSAEQPSVEIPLDTDDTTVVIAVTPPGGQTVTYTVTVVRQGAEAAAPAGP
ncbi:cadherin-like beta sandwich domain-containing protein [Brevibacillus thermoruber]|uniref:Cadherin-like beta sandwich domain-containing protein n=1 Tax=Brevibacillus thermoruber TaxID=33942 RepID=A0A9X3TNV7_9BACL|nr:cadherin-like beta sandwich domain-containing protein [Brevibacillus thermoruber]MDA5107739.1 cadherin-like beta sandwich domain-containing protein [Brevibacillus thermoruber]